MTRSSTFVLFLCVAQLVVAVPHLGSPLSDTGDETRVRPTIAADFGLKPFVPARSGGDSTTSAITNWAAPDTSIELLPLPVDAAPFIMTRDVARFGFPRGIERPPKSSL